MKRTIKLLIYLALAAYISIKLVQCAATGQTRFDLEDIPRNPSFIAMPLDEEREAAAYALQQWQQVLIPALEKYAKTGYEDWDVIVTDMGYWQRRTFYGDRYEEQLDNGIITEADYDRLWERYVDQPADYWWIEVRSSDKLPSISCHIYTLPDGSFIKPEGSPAGPITTAPCLYNK